MNTEIDFKAALFSNHGHHAGKYDRPKPMDLSYAAGRTKTISKMWSSKVTFVDVTHAEIQNNFVYTVRNERRVSIVPRGSPAPA